MFLVWVWPRWLSHACTLIRQPYAEEILRGIKKIEYRNRATKIVGETFYICAGKKVPDRADTAERFEKLGSKVGAADGAARRHGEVRVQRLVRRLSCRRHEQTTGRPPREGS